VGPFYLPIPGRGVGPFCAPITTGHWHRALRQITGADPVPPADRGNLDKAAEAWLRWGKKQGYEW